MENVDGFMREFLAARISEEKQVLANRVPYRKRFFVTDCKWDSRARTLEMIESEHVVIIDESAGHAKVITAYKNPFSKLGVQTFRRRYHLTTSGERWQIQLVENECFLCKGNGDATCHYCKGKH